MNNHNDMALYAIGELSFDEIATVTGGVAMAGTGFDTNHAGTGTGFSTSENMEGTGVYSNDNGTGLVSECSEGTGLA